MSTYAPIPKITAAALGGAVASVAVWALDSGGVEAPPAIAAALASLFAFLAGYIKAPAGTDDAGEVELLYVVLVVTVVVILLAVLGVF